MNNIHRSSTSWLSSKNKIEDHTSTDQD